MKLNIGTLFSSIASFFIASHHPAVTKAAAEVSGPLQQLAQAAGPALDSVADSMANDALSHIPDGQIGTPVADLLINNLIGKLTAKLSPAAAAA